MKSGKMAVALAAMGLSAPSVMAAVRPAAATNLVAMPAAPMAAGARIGATTNGHRSALTSTGTALAVAGVAAAGVGIAAAAGAFDSNHHDNTVSP